MLTLYGILLGFAVTDPCCLSFVSFACQTTCGRFSCTSGSGSYKISSTVHNSRDVAPKIDSFSEIFLTSSGLTRASELASFKRWSLIGFDISFCVNSMLRVLCFFAACLELFFLRFHLHLDLVNALIKVQTSGTLLSFSAYCALLCVGFGAPRAMLLGFDTAGWLTGAWSDPLLALVPWEGWLSSPATLRANSIALR